MEQLVNKILQLKEEGCSRNEIEWRIKRDFDFIHCEGREISRAVSNAFKEKKNE